MGTEIFPINFLQCKEKPQEQIVCLALNVSFVVSRFRRKQIFFEGVEKFVEVVYSSNEEIQPLDFFRPKHQKIGKSIDVSERFEIKHKSWQKPDISDSEASGYALQIFRRDPLWPSGHDPASFSENLTSLLSKSSEL
jgi:hypothetical protein